MRRSGEGRIPRCFPGSTPGRRRRRRRYAGPRVRPSRNSATEAFESKSRHRNRLVSMPAVIIANSSNQTQPPWLLLGAPLAIMSHEVAQTQSSTPSDPSISPFIRLNRAVCTSSIAMTIPISVILRELARQTRHHHGPVRGIPTFEINPASLRSHRLAGRFSSTNHHRGF